MTTQALGHETRTNLQVFAEMFGALLLLLATTAAARANPLHLAPGSWPDTLEKLLPLIPIWLLLVAMVRHYFRIDELQRLKFLQAFALSAGIVCCAYWSYEHLRKFFVLPEYPGDWTMPFALGFALLSVVLAKLPAAPRRP